MTSDRKEPASRKWIGILVVVLALIWLAIWQRERIAGWFSSAPEPALETEAHTDDTNQEDAAVDAAAPTEAELRWEARTGSAPVWTRFGPQPPGFLSAESEIDCDALDREWGRSCEVLATEAQAADVDGGTDPCDRMDSILTTLMRTPPSFSGEMRNHGRMIANVTHLFRTLGRAELTALQAELRRDPEAFEANAAIAARRAVFLGTCAPELKIPEDAAYRYAAYLFGSLGGQAYLRRRTPRVEALATYYALVTLDDADLAGRNPEGMDIRPEIARTRELILGQSFLFESDYLNRLDRMQARWEQRTP